MSGLPSPWLSATIVAAWLLLSQSLSAGHVVLALVAGVVIPRVCRTALPPLPRLRRPLALLGYIALVLWDILAANARVARLTLGPARNWRPRVVSVPLDVSEPVVVSILAATVTLTPGTVSVHADLSARRLEVHALGVADSAAVAADIKSRYERRLKEIFEC